MIHAQLSPRKIPKSNEHLELDMLLLMNKHLNKISVKYKSYPMS